MIDEIERKFLVRNNGWRQAADPGVRLRQGYLCSGPGGPLVRARVAGDQGFLTIKGPVQGIRRTEFEYPIPAEEACWMIDHLCEGRVVSKTRFRVENGGQSWEVDEFLDENQGLVLAEIELDREDREVVFPAWLGEEVSHDFRYTNASLARHPFRCWALAP